ncbi:MAG: hypothetical protein CMM60_07935 [Rhodospirillaceae bacterium]|jgi:hypothetical protein|nr:hypothetical protein [Rhodospirillaceae bacterium]|tara:strand:+ start:975 stop:1280 length:306 start_codon:yes stop_codon:yes gene_type:complete
MSEPTNPDDGREFERKDVLFSARLQVGDKTHGCKIINISLGGAQVHLGRTLKSDETAVLEIEPFGSFNTEIRWSANGNVGIKFNDDQTKVAELIMAIATYA